MATAIVDSVLDMTKALQVSRGQLRVPRVWVPGGGACPVTVEKTVLFGLNPRVGGSLSC